MPSTLFELLQTSHRQIPTQSSDKPIGSKNRLPCRSNWHQSAWASKRALCGNPWIDASHGASHASVVIVELDPRVHRQRLIQTLPTRIARFGRVKPSPTHRRYLGMDAQRSASVQSACRTCPHQGGLPDDHSLDGSPDSLPPPSAIRNPRRAKARSSIVSSNARTETALPYTARATGARRVARRGSKNA